MEENIPSLILRYNNQEKLMHFFPKTFLELRDYFLTIFKEKSSKTFLFKSYLNNKLNKTSSIIFSEENDFTYIRRLKLLKKPAIFICEFDEENENFDMDEFDKENLKYIEEKLNFELKNIESNYDDLNKFKAELERKINVLKNLLKRTEYLSKGINNLKELRNFDGSVNLEDLMNASGKMKENQKEIDDALKNLKDNPVDK